MSRGDAPADNGDAVQRADRIAGRPQPGSRIGTSCSIGALAYVDIEPMRRIAITASASCLLVLGSVGFVQLRGDAAWRDMQSRLGELEHEWTTQDFRRDAPFGDTSPGDARTHYAAALEAARQLSRDDARLVAMLPHTDDNKVAGTEALLVEWQTALDELHAGAAATTCAWPPRSFDSQVANLLSARWLTNVAVLRARSERLAGRPLAAVRDTLAAAQFGADYMRSDLLIDRMIGLAMLAIATIEAWPEPALRQLDVPALDELAEGLRRIDASLPESIDMRGELLALGRTLRGTPDGLGNGAWKFAFSQRWMMADAFTSLCEILLDDRDDAVSWPQRQQVLQRRITSLGTTHNDLVAMCAPNVENAERSHRAALAQLRLLRIAVELHRGRAAPELRDPLGSGALAVVSTEAGAEVRSAGTIGTRPIVRAVTR